MNGLVLLAALSLSTGGAEDLYGHRLLEVAPVVPLLIERIAGLHARVQVAAKAWVERALPLRAAASARAVLRVLA